MFLICFSNLSLFSSEACLFVKYTVFIYILWCWIRCLKVMEHVNFLIGLCRSKDVAHECIGQEVIRCSWEITKLKDNQ